MTASTTETSIEDVEAFRLRARAWLPDHLPRLAPGHVSYEGLDTEARWARNRELQRILWDGGFAGICFPEEYGGLGLTPAHQRAFTEESLEYEMPLALNMPTFTILAATLVDFGTHEQKLRHLPAILRGEEVWVQFLSEPTGGSDLAGCLTRADRDGDVWILNGSKIWSSSAHVADYAMCLARTNWDVPKHRGLTMFIMKIHQPGVEVEQIKQVSGSMEFCQEFFDDVVLPADSVIGDVDDGWTVATRLLTHERVAVGGGSPYASGRLPAARSADDGRDTMFVQVARESGRATDPLARQLVAEARVLDVVHGALVRRVTAAMQTGALPGQAPSLLKLFGATSSIRKAEIGFTIGGSQSVAWMLDEHDASSDRGSARRQGERYPSRQTMGLGGGSNEIQRNIISERVLGMPREWAADRDVPYREVRTNVMPTSPRDVASGSEGGR